MTFEIGFTPRATTHPLINVVTNLGVNFETGGKPMKSKKGKRREWDSNPRWSFPHTRFPSVLLKPLGHLSEANRLYHNRISFQPGDDRPLWKLDRGLEEAGQLTNEARNVEFGNLRRARPQIT